ncbi:MAG: hypothetical protein M3345_00085 [Actinomycetota bacterium]|nr:hypothetical protein [Actinomycetota bacterium]
MKRFLILFMILGLIAGSVATAEAKKGQKPTRTERTVEGSYATQFVPFNVWCYQHRGVGCVEIETRKDEAFLTAKAVDAHGQPVLVQVRSKDPSSGPAEWIRYGSFCGETDEPIAFDRGADVDLVIGYDGSGLSDLAPSLSECRPGIGTTGTVSVTLSNRP